MSRSGDSFYDEETRRGIEASLFRGLSTKKLTPGDWERIETSAALYLSLLRNKPQRKDLRDSLERLQKSVRRLENDLENALPVLELAIHEAEAHGGLSRLVSDLEENLSSLSAVIDTAENKIRRGKGRKKEPSLEDGPNIIIGVDYNVGSHLQSFIMGLADIWKKYTGQWPKRRSNAYANPRAGERSDRYPKGWKDFVSACIAPIEKRWGRSISGVDDAMRQVGIVGKN